MALLYLGINSLEDKLRIARGYESLAKEAFVNCAVVN
jgi:hypothetical protein